MKVSELLQESNGAYYKPTYQTYTGGKIRGSVPDWLKAMGVSKEDVAKAYPQVKKTPEYEAILALGMSDESGDREMKNGTLNFIGYVDEPRDFGYNIKHVKNNRIRYKVLANGKIDVVAPNDYNRYDLPVPKPVIVKGDPVQTVVKTMTNSLKRLHEVLSKRMEKAKKGVEKYKKNQVKR